MRSAWTGPQAPARFAHTGWDTYPASLALLTLLALTVLLHATWKFKSLVLKYLTSISHLNNIFGGRSSYKVPVQIHSKSPMGYEISLLLEFFLE